LRIRFIWLFENGEMDDIPDLIHSSGTSDDSDDDEANEPLHWARPSVSGAALLSNLYDRLHNVPALVYDSSSGDDSNEYSEESDSSEPSLSDGEFVDSVSEPGSLPALETPSSSSSGSSSEDDGSTANYATPLDNLSLGSVENTDDESSLPATNSRLDDTTVMIMLRENIDNMSSIPNFLTVSLRMLYQHLIDHFDDDRDAPTREEVLARLPLVKVEQQQREDSGSCSICFVEYEPEEFVLQLPCNHFYHKQCIVKWLKMRSTCPNCRLDLNFTQESQNESSTIGNSGSILNHVDVSRNSGGDDDVTAMIQQVGRWSSSSSFAQTFEGTSDSGQATSTILHSNDLINQARSEVSPVRLRRNSYINSLVNNLSSELTNEIDNMDRISSFDTQELESIQVRTSSSHEGSQVLHAREPPSNECILSGNCHNIDNHERKTENDTKLNMTVDQQELHASETIDPVLDERIPLLRETDIW